MLILASQSTTRQRLLRNAGVEFEAVTAPIDERHEEGMSTVKDPSEIALHLAQAKATSVSQSHPDAYVLGADQLLTCNGQHFHKPKSTAAARDQLRTLRGASHELHTAISVVYRNRCVMTAVSVPRLTMRHFSDAFLEAYLTTQPPGVLHSPGCYRYEEQGIQLFDHIDGDMHSILGLPMLPLLAFLRSKDLLPS